MKFLACILLCLFVVACSDEEPEIGDHCDSSAECPTKCQSGGGFPDGICTRECDENADCPGGWVCVSKSSGICLQECSDTSECTADFGDSWVCDDEALQSGEGDAQVCIGK